MLYSCNLNLLINIFQKFKLVCSLNTSQKDQVKIIWAIWIDRIFTGKQRNIIID